MRVFAVSDIHIDFEENRRWFNSLSGTDYQNDVLILAGDLMNGMTELANALEHLRKIFGEVLYVPGNHELWVKNTNGKDSLERFDFIRRIAVGCGIHMQPVSFDTLTIVPLFGWYDYSFGQPSEELKKEWIDYSACKWPADFDEAEITRYFIEMNKDFVHIENKDIISFSHFMSRIDLMPVYIPLVKRRIYPVLGSSLLEKQIRQLGSKIHIYGHSHVNRHVHKNGTLYINNAFAYPYETSIAVKKLICVFET